MAERVVQVSGCDEEGLCDWKELKQKYRKAVNDCSTKFCFENMTKTLQEFNVIDHNPSDMTSGTRTVYNGFGKMGLFTFMIVLVSHCNFYF